MQLLQCSTKAGQLRACTDETELNLNILSNVIV